MKMSSALGAATVSAVLFGSPHTASAQTPEPAIKLRIVSTTADTLQLGDRLRVVVDSLQAAIAAHQVEAKNLILSLNGYVMRGIPSERAQDTLIFTLERGDSSRAAWAALLGSPKARIRQMLVGIARPDGVGVPWANPAAARSIKFRLFTMMRFFLAVALAAGLLARVLFLVTKRRMAGEIRQPLKLDTTGFVIKVDEPQPAASLGQLQLLWWTYLIVCGFLFIWLLTGDYNGIVTSQALVLMGLSAATTAIAKGVGEAHSSHALRRIDELSQNGRVPAATAPQKTEIQQLIGRTGKRTDKRFWHELFAADGGLNIQRVQFGIWTAVLGVAWVFAVYKRLSFPEFEPTLLTLMGISAGTYATLKVTERQPTAVEHKQSGTRERPDERSYVREPQRDYANAHNVHRPGHENVGL